MTEEIKRIEEQKLEEEMENLRSEINSLKSKLNELSEKKKTLQRDPNSIPLKLQEKYPSIFSREYGEIHMRYFLNGTFVRLIKRISIGEKREKVKRVRDFTDEEYEKYCYVLDKFLQLTNELYDEMR